VQVRTERRYRSLPRHFESCIRIGKKDESHNLHSVRRICVFKANFCACIQPIVDMQSRMMVSKCSLNMNVDNTFLSDYNIRYDCITDKIGVPIAHRPLSRRQAQAFMHLQMTEQHMLVMRGYAPSAIRHGPASITGNGEYDDGSSRCRI